MNQTLVALLFSAGMYGTLLSTPAIAASSDSSDSAAAARAKKTVGELLKQSSMEVKKKTALPTFNNQFTPSPSATPSVDLSQVKPPRTASFMEGADDKAKLEHITDEQIQELYHLVEKFKNSSRRGELWLRLAELYVEKAGLVDFRKQAEYDQALKEYHDGKTKVKPTLDVSDARSFNLKAIQLYEWFVRDFPKDEKMDQAIYFLGYNYFEMNEVQKGFKYYSKLTAEYPQSPFVIESHFALGEYFFENEKWKEALAHYAAVAQHRRHRLYGFASYKMAWSEFRSGDTPQALRTMERIIRENREQGAVAAEGKKISKVRLEKEALRDLVLFFAEDVNYQRAPEYFNRVSAGDPMPYLERLAYLYVEKGNREAARFIFNFLIQKDPTNAKAFDYKYQITQAYASASKTREFREELYSWVKDFGPSGRWYQVNKANTSLIESSTKLRETTMKNWVLTQHQTAQNSHAKFTQGLAYEGYKVYLQEFTNSASTPDMHFFFAELLYDMDRFEEASVHYQWVVDNAPNSKYASKAAENALLSLEHSVPKDNEIAETVGKSVDPVAFNPHTDKFVKAALWYIEKFPSAAKIPEVKFRVGRLYYQHNQFDKAIGYFKDIVQNYPTTKYAEYSANLLLDSYNLKKDYAGLEKTGQELLAVPSIANSHAGKDIRQVIEKAAFKKAQDLEVSKDYGSSAQQFEAFAKQNPTAPLATAASFDAAINYERAGKNSKAIDSYVVVLNSSSKDAAPLKLKSRRNLAKLYQDSGRLEEASVTYQQAAVEAGKDPLAPNMYYNAAILDQVLGKNKAALENYQSYIDRAKKENHDDAIWQMASIHRRAGQHKAAADKYKEYFTTAKLNEKSIEAAFWIYSYHRGQQQAHEMLVWRQKLYSAQNQLSPGKKGVGANWAAKVALDDVTQTFYEMRNLKIPADPNRQAQVAQKKIAMLTTINKQIADVIKYDSPEEIVSALNLLGRANQNLGEALVNAPLPAGLKPDEAKAYRDGIQKVADPFLQKARESFKSAIDRGSDLEAYGKDLDYSREVMAKLDPAVYPDHGEVPSNMNLQDWQAAP